VSSLTELAQAVFQGDFRGSSAITQQLIDGGVTPMEIINQGLLAGMDIVAPKFKAGEMFVPEVMMSARALAEGMKLVKPLISDEDASKAATIVIGTVQGDLHDIGKNLVVMLLESGGFNVIDLGVDVAPDKFVAAIKEYSPKFVGMSALLTTTMMSMKETIDAIKEAGLRDQVTIMVGGAPLSQEFADRIGADVYCLDAVAAKEAATGIVVNAAR